MNTQKPKDPYAPKKPPKTVVDRRSESERQSDRITAGFKAIDRSSLTVKVPRFIKAQFMHETGAATSNVFVENNNMFGMKCAIYRTYYQDGCRPNGYANYSSYERSVQDLNNWIDNALQREAQNRLTGQNVSIGQSPLQGISSNTAMNPFGGFLGNITVAPNQKLINDEISVIVAELEAGTVADYARFLSNQGYFTDSLSNYTNGLQAWITKV